MCSTSPIRRSAGVALVLLGAVIVWRLMPAWHPVFGVIHHSGVIHYYQYRQRMPAKFAAWVDAHSPLRLNLCRHIDCSPRLPRWDGCLTLGTNQLYWSLNNPQERTGWLNFSTIQAFSTNGVWEFAPCSQKSLMDISQADLSATFVGIGDPRGPGLFGTNWTSRALRVAQGQVVLARRVRHAGPIFVVLLRRQTGSMEAGKVALQIEYILAPAAQRAKRTKIALSGARLGRLA